VGRGRGVCGQELWGGASNPLTPDPSPPFHGGEGRISGQWSVQYQADGLTRSREAAKSRREPQGVEGGLNLCCMDELMVFAPLMEANVR